MKRLNRLRMVCTGMPLPPPPWPHLAASLDREYLGSLDDDTPGGKTTTLKSSIFIVTEKLKPKTRTTSC